MSKQRALRASKAIKLLTKAKEWLAGDKNRWVQRAWIVADSKGVARQACLIGAVAVASGRVKATQHTLYSPEELAALAALAGVIRPESARLHEDHPFEFWAQHIFGFNDSSRTRAEDVLATLDLAIEGECKIVQSAIKNGDLPEPTEEPNEPTGP